MYRQIQILSDRPHILKQTRLATKQQKINLNSVIPQLKCHYSLVIVSETITKTKNYHKIKSFLPFSYKNNE